MPIDIPDFYGIDADWPEDEPLMNEPSLQELHSAIAATRPVEEVAKTVTKTAISPVDICDLMTQFPQEQKPLVHGLWRYGDVINLNGDPKSKKSWAAYDLAISVCLGLDWFGKFPCERGKVLLLDNELRPATVANRVPQVARARSINPEDLRGRLFVHSLRGRLMGIQDVGQRIVDGIQQDEFALIICDAKYRFMQGDENSNDAQTMFYNLVDNYAEQTGAAWVLVHHNTKGDQSSKKVTDIGSGGGSQSRAADAHIVLREHEEDDCIVLDSVVRTFKEPEPLVLRWCYPVWQPQEHLDPQALKQPKTRGDSRQDIKDSKAMDQIRDAFRKSQTAELTTGRIKTLTGMGSERATRILNLMEDAVFVREEPTRNGTSTAVWMLESEQTD